MRDGTRKASDAFVPREATGVSSVNHPTQAQRLAIPALLAPLTSWYSSWRCLLLRSMLRVLLRVLRRRHCCHLLQRSPLLVGPPQEVTKNLNNKEAPSPPLSGRCSTRGEATGLVVWGGWGGGGHLAFALCSLSPASHLREFLNLPAGADPSS